MNTVDAWDAPAYSATRAVLDTRYPAVSAFLFQKLEAATGTAAVAGVKRFLDRIDLLRDGQAPNVDPDSGRTAVELKSRGSRSAGAIIELRSVWRSAGKEPKSPTSRRPRHRRREGE